MRIYRNLTSNLLCAAIAITLVAVGSTEVIGYVDTLIISGLGWHVGGWACDRGLAAQIEVHAYVGGPARGQGRTAAATANRDGESGIQVQCGASPHHRFHIQIPFQSSFNGQPLWVYGLSVSGPCCHNTLTSGSGERTLPPIAPPIPPTPPPPTPPPPSPPPQIRPPASNICTVGAWNDPATSCTGTVIAEGSMANSDSPADAAAYCEAALTAQPAGSGTCCMFHLFGYDNFSPFFGDHFWPIYQLHSVPHTPCALPNSVSMRIGW